MWEQRKIFHCSFSFAMKRRQHLQLLQLLLSGSVQGLPSIPTLQTSCRHALAAPHGPGRIKSRLIFYVLLLPHMLQCGAIFVTYQCTNLDRLGFLSRNQDLAFSAYTAKIHQDHPCTCSGLVLQYPSVNKNPFADFLTLTEVLMY